METYRYFLSVTNKEFMELCEQWVKELKKAGAAAAYAWDEADVDGVYSAISAFLMADKNCSEFDTTENKKARKTAKDAAKEKMKVFAASSIRNNTKMNATAKGAFGIQKKDEYPSVVVEIHSYPQGKEDTSIERVVGISFKDNVSGKRVKPHGVRGARICWALLDHRPTSFAELINADFRVSGPITIQLDEGDTGKRLYYCLRWEGIKNVKGPYSPIRSVSVP